MTRRRTLSIAPDGDDRGASCEADAIVAQPTRDRVHAIVLEPPDTASNAEPTVVWIGEPGEITPGAAPQVIACTPEIVACWLSEGVPAWLWARRLDGILVQYDTSAAASTRQAARALRDRLAPRSAAGLAELAELAGEPALANTLARMPAHHVPSFADLARGLARSDDPKTRRTARLLWALEHL
jgi:hypothetical protein